MNIKTLSITHVTIPFSEECSCFCHEPSTDPSQFTRPASVRINGTSCALALTSIAAFSMLLLATHS